MGSAAFLVASIALPFAEEQRAGLLFVAAAVVAYSVVWYRVLPPGAFGEWRYEIAGSFIQLLAVVTLLLSGGVASLWFAFYLLPPIATVFSYRPRATAVVGGTAAIGIVVCAILLPTSAGDPAATQDVTILRLIELAAVGSMAFLITRTMRRSRAALVVRESELREALASTERDALTDPLTGVHNRRSLEQALNAVTSRAARDTRPYALLIVDVDGLKSVNDRAGHVAGDTLLRLVANAATDAVRAYDVVARFGGDEFVVVINDTTDESARRTADRIHQRFAHLVAEQPALAGTTISVGAATWEPGKTTSELLAEADAQMYAGKRARRGTAAAGN